MGQELFFCVEFAIARSLCVVAGARGAHLVAEGTEEYFYKLLTLVHKRVKPTELGATGTGFALGSTNTMDDGVKLT